MIKKVLVFLATLLLINSTYANPEGGVVSAGSATITSPDASTVQINQASDKAIINWQSFNINSSETTRFVQPNSGSIALNRIDPQQGASQIFGRLQANGQLILVNQAGIYFGPGSRVDVAGIIASTTNITDENFLAGYYSFDQKSSLYNGSIINKGTLIAADHGLIALIGSAVSNEGLVQAQLGNVVLASGNKFTVGFDNAGMINFTVDEGAAQAGQDQNNHALAHGVNNSGTVIANGGTILMTAKSVQGVMDHVINMDGVAQARSVQEKNGAIIFAGDDQGTTYVSGKVDASGTATGEAGGEVKVLGYNVALDANTLIDASGDQGGGTVLIGGNMRGEGPEQNAENVFFSNEANILANALTQGDGGKVVIWSNNYTQAYGNIEAMGGVLGGNGGTIETSSHNLLVMAGTTGGANARSSTGVGGEWLIDPRNVTISTAATTNPPGSTFGGTGTFTPVSDSSNVLNTDITAKLNAGTSVNITTGATGLQAGTITLNAATPISWSNSSSLTLTAANAITLNSAITNAGVGSVTITAGNASPITFAAGSGVTTTPSTAVNGAQNYSAGSYIIGTGASVTLSTTGGGASTGSITFNGGASGMDGAGNLTLASNGTINLGATLIGTNTPLTTFTTTTPAGTGILTGTGTILSIRTTGSQIHNATINAPASTSFVALTSTGGGSVTLNKSLTTPGQFGVTSATGGLILNGTPTINAEAFNIGGGANIVPITLLSNATFTTSNTSTITNTLNGAINGNFTFALNPGASSTTNFNGTVSVGSITTTGTNTIAFNGGNVTTTGTQTYSNGFITATPLTVSATTLTIGSTGTIDAGSNNLTLAANTMTFNNAANTITGTGALTLAPLVTGSGTIGVNGGGGTLQITTSILSKLNTTFTGLSIGAIGTSGVMAIGGATTFTTPSLTLNAGSFTSAAANVVTVTTPAGAAGSGALTLNAITGAIATNISPFGLLATNLTLNTTNASAFLNSTSGINFNGASAVGTGALTLNMGGSVTQSVAGTITITGAGSLVATLTGASSALNLNSASNAISNIGSITAPGGFSLTNGNNPTTATTGITTTSNPITISTGIGGYTQSNNVDLIVGGTGNAPITITSDTIAIGTTNAGNNAFQTSNVLTLKPFSAATTMSLAGAATYDLTATEIARFTTGVTGSVVIGDAAASTGSLTTGGAVTFGALPLTLNAGSFVNASATNIITAGTVNLLARNAGGAIGAAGAANAIRIAATNLSFNTTGNGNAFLASAAGTNINTASSVGSGTLTFTTMGGNVTQSAAGAVTAGTLVGTLTAGALNLNSASNAISNLGVITAPGGFNLTNGNTSTTVIGAIGTTNNAVSINVGTGTYQQNNFDITSGTGAITITGDAVIIAANTTNNAFITTGVLTLNPSSANTAMSLASSSPSAFDLSTTEITDIQGGVTGAGSIVIGNAANSSGVLTIGGAANFAGKTLTLNAGSFTDTGTNVITATTLNLLARTGTMGATGNGVDFAATNLSVNTLSNNNAFITSTGGVNINNASNLGIGTLTLNMGNSVTQTAAGVITGGLTATLSTGALTLNTATNAISTLGPITAPGGVTLTNGNNPTTITGNINTTNTAVSINTGTGLYSQNNADIITGSGAITIIGDSIALASNSGNNAFQTTGALLLRPSTAATTMSLGGSSTFDLTAAEISALSTGVTGAGTITIGNSAASTGALTVSGNIIFNSTFGTDAPIFIYAGSMDGSGSNRIQATTLNLTSRNSGASIGGTVAVGVNSANLSLTTTGNGNASISGVGALNFTGATTVGSGTLSISNDGVNQLNVTQGATGIITAGTLTALLTDVISGSTLNLSSASNVITNVGTITADGGFALTNGNNPLTVTGNINTSAGPVNISTGTALYTQNDVDIIAGFNSPITITSNAIAIANNSSGDAFQTSNVLTLKPFSAATLMSLAGAAAYDLSAAEITSIRSGIITSGGSIVIGDTGSTGSLTTGGAADFLTNTVTLNAGSFVNASAANIITAGTLNLFARSAGGAIGATGAATSIRFSAPNISVNTTGNGNAFIASLGGTNFNSASSLGTGTLTLTSMGNTVTQSAAGVITAGNLIATLTAGALNLNTASNAITNLGAITAPGGFSLTNALTLNATTTATANITTTNNPINISTGTSTGGYTQNNNIDFITGTGAITITSDAIILGTNTGNNAFQTETVLTLKPFSAATSMSLAAGTAAFDLTQAEITSFISGLGPSAYIEMGNSAASTGVFTTAGPSNFSSFTVNLFAGSFANASASNIITAGSLNLTARNASGAIGATGAANAIRISSPINLTLNTNNGDAFIASAGGASMGTSFLGSGNLTFTSMGSSVTQQVGGVITANSLSATLAAGSLDFNNASNAISNLGVITAPNGFNLTNGNNSTTVTGAINTTNSAVTIHTGTGTYAQNDFDISTGSGAITITSDAINIATNTGNNAYITTGALTLKPFSAATNMSLAGASAYDLTAAEVTSLLGGITGSGTISIGDAAASTGILNIGGAVSFGTKVINLNAGSYTDPASSVVTAGTLNLLARNPGGSVGANANALGISATNLSVNTTGNGDAFFTSTGGINWGGSTSSVGTGTLSYIETGAGGAVSQTGNITAGSVVINAIGGIVLNGSNAISGFSATNTSSGAIQLSTAASNLTLAGISQAGTGQILINNTGGAVTTSGTIATIGIGNIGLTASTTVSINNQINSTSGNVSLTGSGINVGANMITTGGNILFNNPVTLTANGISLNSSTGNTTFSNTLAGGGFSLATTTSGSGVTTFSNTASNLSSLTTTGTTAINTTNITTTGAQTYNNGVTLGANAILTSTAGNITLANTLTGGAQSLTLTGGASGSHLFTLNDIASLGTLTINGNAAVTNTLALLTGSGTNTWTVSNNGGSAGSNGTIAATNITSGGFSNIQNLTGGAATNNFVFNNGAAIIGNIVGGGSGSNNTLNVSALTSPTVNLTTNTATGIGGTFSTISHFRGTDTGATANSTISGLGNTTVSSANTGNSGTNNFVGFGNLISSGSNTFTFQDNASITGNLTGGGTDSLDFSAYSTSISVNAAGTSTGIGGTFSGFTNFTGGAGSNTFTNATGSNTWTISNNNAGSISGKNFNAFGTLVGGSGDTFALANGKSISSISATAGILDYSAYSTAVSVNGAANTATNVGSLSGITSFTGGAGSNTFTNATGSNTWTISNDNAGSISGKNFSAFGTLVGGSGDTFALANGKSIGSISATSGTLDYSAYSTAVSVNGASNTATNVGTLSGITTFTGGAGSNTFTNATGSNTWTISNDNAGSISGKNFNAFGTLVGGSGDTFALANGKSIGSISATSGTLDYSAYSTAVSVNGATNTATNVGTLSGITTFTGGAGSNTFTNATGSNTWTISNDNVGSISGKNFSAFGTLVGGSADTFALANGKSIGSISATAGILDYSAYSTAVSVNGASNTATNVGSLSGITTFTGGAGSNTFTNATGSNTWNISNDNAGSISGKNFSAFGTLVGGSADTFALANGKSIGSISATAGTLDYSAYSTAVSVNGATNTATNVGTLSGITSFTGGAGSNTFTNATGSNIWNISNDNAGSISGKNFSAFGTLVGGSGDTFALANGKSISSISATAGILDYSAYSTAVSVNGASNTATNVGSLSGITTFTGGAGSNTFTNATGSNTWNISNDNAGSISGKNFSAFGTLVGGSGDTFALANGKSISSISATAGILDYSAYSTAVSVNGASNTATNVGSLSGITTFTGGAGSNTFTNATGSNTWTISNDNAGSISGKNFSAFGTLVGGSGDIFALANGKSIGSISATSGTLDYSAYSTAISVNGASNTATNVGTLSGITTFTGGAGSNTFTNAAGSNTWTISNDNAGSISGKNFNAFGTLVGGSGDIFALANGKSIGSISATSGTLDYSAYSTAVSVNGASNTATNVGTLSGITTFTGGAGSNTFTNATGSNTWTISNDNAGSISGKNFSAFGTLVGGSADTFALANGKSIGSISATAGTLDYSAYTTAVSVNGATNTATNVGTLSGITSFTGGAGSNTFTNATGSNTWNISNDNAGSISGKNFSAFGTLVGGSADTFALANGKSIGSISATAGTLDYSAYTTAVSVNGAANTGTNVGSLTGITSFTGGAGSNTFTNATGSNTWNISNDNAGSISGKNFSAFGTLVGGSADTFALANGKSIGSISATAGTLDYSAYTTAVSVNGAANTGTNVGSLTGITSFTGGAGSNTFTNATGSNTWNISNDNAGSISGKNFSAFGTLVGGSGDTFALANGKSIGSISATAGTLDYSAYTTAVSVNGAANTGTNVGSLTGITSFTGGAGSNTFTNATGSNTWTISNDNAGSISGKNFNAFGTLIGGSGDTFALANGKSIGSISATSGTLDYSAYSTAVSVNGASNTATNVGTLSGITTFTGGAGSNTFTNATGSNTWTISNDNAGSISGKNFNAFGTLVGGSGDTFALANGKSISSISATAGILDYSAYSTAVSVNGASNTATNVGSLIGITTFTGGAGSNTFTNATGSNTWNISNDNAGSISGKNFSAFGTLVGGSGDTFALANGKSISSISATAGILDYSAYSTAVSVNGASNTATNVGSLSGITTFTGGAGSNTFTNATGSNTWTISNDNAGSISGKNFSAFGTLVGGSADTFALANGKSIGSISATAGTLDYSAYSTAVSVNGATNTATNISTLSGITSFTGGAGSNTFTNATGSNIWNISNDNAGSISGKNFSAFGTLVGGSGDTFALANGKSISNISATAGILDYSAYSTAVSVNGASNTATNVGSLSGITTFTGGAGSNTFTNATGSNTWTISNDNAGSISGKNFSAFGTLVGGSADTFALANGKSISSISATAGILDYSAYSTAVSVNGASNTATNVGSLSGITTFTGGAGSNTFTNAAGSNTWTISNDNAGSISGKNFNAFGTLVGGSGDTFALANGKSISSISATSGSLDYSAYTTAVAVNGASNTATNIGSLSGITTFTGGAGSNTFTNTAGSNTWNISNNNVGSIAGKNFNAFGSLVGGSSDTFVFGNNSAAISGNLTGGGNATLDVSALTSPTVNLQTQTSNGIGGTFSGISHFTGSGVSSSLVGTDNTTWHINSHDGGTVGSNTFSGFGNLMESSGNNEFIFDSGGDIDGAIVGGSGTNTLTIAAGNTNWLINATNSGNVTGVGGGFSNIQNLTGSSTGTNTFTFTGSGAVTGLINGGNTTQMNTVDYSGSTQPITLTLSAPTSGNEFNSGEINNSIITDPFTNIQQIIGNSLTQNYIVLPNKSNITVVYTNAERTSGYIGDPFFFTNFIIHGFTPPVPPAPTPTPTQLIPVDIAQIITPFTQNQTDTTVLLPIALTPNGIVDQSINQMLDQQTSLDTQIEHTLAVGCYQIAN